MMAIMPMIKRKCMAQPGYGLTPNPPQSLRCVNAPICLPIIQIMSIQGLFFLFVAVTRLGVTQPQGDVHAYGKRQIPPWGPTVIDPHYRSIRGR